MTLTNQIPFVAYTFSKNQYQVHEYSYRGYICTNIHQQINPNNKRKLKAN